MPSSNQHKSPAGNAWLTALVIAAISLGIAMAAIATWVLMPFSGDIAGAVREKAGSLQVSSQIRDFEGRELGAYSDESRYVVPLRQIPTRVRKAFIAAEDDAFWKHRGVSPKALVRAIVANLRRDRFAQGGSTITQQVVRQLLLPREKTMARKLREIVLALALERQMKKREILDLWLNSVYLGNNSWGVEAAARNYFNKHVNQLTTAEATLLAGLPQAPSLYAPHSRPKLARKRQLYVLGRMKKLGWLTVDDYKLAKNTKVRVEPRREPVMNQAPWVTETARVELWKRLEQKNLPASGLVVTTTINRDWQLSLQNLVSQKFSRLGENGLEVAIVVMDARSGEIRSIVGGSDFQRSQFNRAIDLDRPLGASVYPLLFVWGMEKGLLTVDGYASIAEAAVKSRFAEAEQIAPEIGYGIVREKLAGLGLSVGDAMAIDELRGSPLALARSYLGIASSPQEGQMASGLISRVISGDKILYAHNPGAGLLSTPSNMGWTVRQWMALGAYVDSNSLVGQPLLKSIKGWNAWWIIPRIDVIVSAWVGAERSEPQSPDLLKVAYKEMDQLIADWIGRHLKPNGTDSTPDGISYQIVPGSRGRPFMRVPFVISGEGVF